MFKPIISFIRFNDAGGVEKVTWYKRSDGSKYLEIEPFKAGKMDIAMMMESPYLEAHV